MISGAQGTIATQAESVLIATRPAGNVPVAGPRAPRRPDRRRLPRRHRRARHRARRRLHQGLRASRLHRGAGDPVGGLREEGERRATDRGDGRGLRDRHRDRPRRASGPAPSRLPSDRRGRGVRRGDGGRQAARTDAAAIVARARHRRLELGRAVRLRQRRRRHQAAARRPRLARRIAGGAAGRSRRRRPARRDRGARRLHAGLCLQCRPRAAGGAAADGAVRHHRLLHQAEPVLPPHPAGGRGADRHPQRREDRERRGQARRGRDLSHRRRACRHRLGRLRQRATELQIPDVAGAQVPRHQGRLFRGRHTQRSGLVGARIEVRDQRAARDRPALSETAPGARDRDHAPRASSSSRPTRRWARGWSRSTTTA